MNQHTAYGDPESGLITGFDQAALDEIERYVQGRVPQEKIDAELRMEKTARIMKAAGSINIPTLGQKIAQIPARTYFRMLADMGQGDASSDEWIEDALRDNPILCAPGYKAGRKADFRHGITFVNGQPVGKGPQILTRKLSA